MLKFIKFIKKKKKEKKELILKFFIQKILNYKF